jgi:phospholipase C
MFRACGISFRSYAQGYAQFVAAAPNCPNVTNGTLVFSPADVPFQFFPNVQDAPYVVDFANFASDVASGSLPAFSFVKPVDLYSRHPGDGVTIRFERAGLMFACLPAADFV